MKNWLVSILLILLTLLSIDKFHADNNQNNYVTTTSTSNIKLKQQLESPDRFMLFLLSIDKEVIEDIQDNNDLSISQLIYNVYHILYNIWFENIIITQVHVNTFHNLHHRLSTPLFISFLNIRI